VRAQQQRAAQWGLLLCVIVRAISVHFVCVLCAFCVQFVWTIRQKYDYKFLCSAAQKCNRIFDAQSAICVRFAPVCVQCKPSCRQSHRLDTGNLLGIGFSSSVFAKWR